MTDDDLRKLEQRVTKGFDVLFEAEAAEETGAEYERWYKNWEPLLRRYENELDRRGVTKAPRQTPAAGLPTTT